MNLDTNVRLLEDLRSRLRELEDRYAGLENPEGNEGRQIRAALASARASLEMAYGSLPQGLLAGIDDEEDRSH